MTIAWLAFVQVAAASLIAACLLVTLFSLGLRVGDGEAAWRRPAAVALFTLCGAVVVLGIFLIIPALHGALGL